MTWTLRNICGCFAPPSKAAVRQFLPALARLLDHDDKKIQVHACRALRYLADGPKERIQMSQKLTDAMQSANPNFKDQKF